MRIQERTEPTDYEIIHALHQANGKGWTGPVLVAQLLDLDLLEMVRRLKQMEKAGLVESQMITGSNSLAARFPIWRIRS